MVIPGSTINSTVVIVSASESQSFQSKIQSRTASGSFLWSLNTAMNRTSFLVILRGGYAGPDRRSPDDLGARRPAPRSAGRLFVEQASDRSFYGDSMIIPQKLLLGRETVD